MSLPSSAANLFCAFSVPAGRPGRSSRVVKKAAASNRALAALTREVRTEPEALVPADFLDAYTSERPAEKIKQINSTT
jgi:hypothetical protein